MEFNTDVLRDDEKIVFTLRSLYASYGYRQYKMSRFEEYDLYVKNKDFLVSDRIITFTDTNGKLMALKPDVTLSIIKSTKDVDSKVERLYYNENVYRASEDSGNFSELMQVGLECIGNLTISEISEVVKLAAESLEKITGNCVLEISHLGIISEIIDNLKLSDKGRQGILRCIKEKNTDTLENICQEEEISSGYKDLIKEITFLYDSPENAAGKLEEVISKSPMAGNENLKNSICELRNVFKILTDEELRNIVKVDFSVSSDLKYYNGIVFSGFIKGIPTSVLSGGQYDMLMKKLSKKSKAIGFAVYLDTLERLEDVEKKEKDGFINIALPKGRLGEKVYEMFAKAGYECPSILENNRKLIFENNEKKVRYFWAKPSDVAVYVERGAADIGVAGKDIILEEEPEIYELLDLNIGKCRMCVAAPEGYEDNAGKTLRVATKFSRIARNYYNSIDREIDEVHLNGSIEIAPILGLTDVIVDIVETGTTLKENKLEVISEIVPISARLIANKSSYKFSSEKIKDITYRLGQMVK